MPPPAFLSTFTGATLASPTPLENASTVPPPRPTVLPPLRLRFRPTMRSLPLDEFSINLTQISQEAVSALRGCPLYFVGAMGSGKSVVAAYAAHALGYRFLDTDTFAAAAAGKEVSAVFAENGEDAFRDLESAVLNEVQAWRATAVATGGGAVLRDKNWASMRAGGVVWLDVDAEVPYTVSPIFTLYILADKDFNGS